jgi:hypothetical protein
MKTTQKKTLKPFLIQQRVGDFVYVSEEEMVNDGAQGDGWVYGTSWLTGCSGFLPKNYVCRTPEPNAWTLHLSLPLGKVLCKIELIDKSNHIALIDLIKKFLFLSISKKAKYGNILMLI